MKVEPSRIQSPSSINTYKQCPRKYYYCYIEKIPTKTNIHLVRGNIVHQVLEDFFDVDFDLTANKLLLGDLLFKRINELFEKEWANEKNTELLGSLDMTPAKLNEYYLDSKNMINTWYFSFLKKMSLLNSDNPAAAFKLLTPQREVLYKSEKYGVRGYIDAIEQIGDFIRLVDYKSSKRAHISDAYKLQLSIYAMMYEEKHGVLPNKVGISFLKFGEDHDLMVTPELVDFAKFEVELIHVNTQFKELVDYPQNVTPLCKWRTGQCDYYDICFPNGK